MSRISIAFGVSEDWLKYTYVTMCSILSNSDSADEYKFYIMCDTSKERFGFEFEKVYQKLSQIRPFEYEFIKMDNSEFDGFVHDERVGVTASYRLKLSSLVKGEKIIYLDSDLVVLGDIRELWDYDITDYYIAGVEDKYSDMMKCRVNLSESDTYFNSGVIVMNLKRFREDRIEAEQKVLEEYKNVDDKGNKCYEVNTDNNGFYMKFGKGDENSFTSSYILHYDRNGNFIQQN